jgi:glycosyltransferase involved in cell wall biosynthesis
LKTVVLRTGRDFCPFLGEDDSWARPHSVELGYVDYPRMPDILSLADLLVQPGRPDRFNVYRFPSKLPEYLCMGRPVLLPAANLGLHLRHGEEALVAPRVDALAIVEAARALVADPALRERLGRGGPAFARARLDWTRSAGELRSFYEGVLHRSAPRQALA